MENNENFVDQLATILDEPNRPMLERMAATFERDRLLDLVHDTLAIEAAGGQLTRTGDRRRTPGGVLVQLVKRTVTADERKACFRRSTNSAVQEVTGRLELDKT